MRSALILGSLLLVGCIDELPLPWDLDHTRVVAVKAEPPGLAAVGEQSELTALLAMEGGLTREAPPENAIVVAPMSLTSALTQDNGRWIVTRPDDAALEAARGELMLEPGAPVLLQVGVAYNGTDLFALKTIALGEARSNPSIDSATINGEPLRDQTELVIDAAVETPLAVDSAELADDVNWLSSVGTMHDFDLPASAYLTVDDDDLIEGELALVFRDPRGGVTWRVWPLRAEGTPIPAL